jgi:aminoglycoside phosphotransferase family enzyme
VDPADYRQRFERDIRANHRELSVPDYGLPHVLLEAITASQLYSLEREAASFDRRAADGKIVEGHGDLRPEHVFLGQEPVFIDCLEFNRDWRLLDPVEEIAYLSLECEYAGAPWIGEVALDTYRERTGDAPAAPLVRFYKSVRASLRAKLSVWHLRDHLEPAKREKWVSRARRYLELAHRYGLSRES